MTFSANGDSAIVAAFVPSGNLVSPQPTNTLNGCAQDIVFVAAQNGVYLWNSGASATGNPVGMRLVQAGNPAHFGRAVMRTGKSAQFVGTVIAAIKIEMNTTGATGGTTECVLVQTEGFRYIALVSDVTFL